MVSSKRLILTMRARIMSKIQWNSLELYSFVNMENNLNQYYINQCYSILLHFVSKIYDAVALCEYIMWLEKTVPSGTVDEINGAAKLKSLRLDQSKSKGLSFSSISAVGSNAAVIHYG